MIANRLHHLYILPFFAIRIIQHKNYFSNIFAEIVLLLL